MTHDPPDHLSSPMRAWWSHVEADYALDDEHRLLQTDRAEHALAEGRVDAMIIADPPTVPSAVATVLGWEPGTNRSNCGSPAGARWCSALPAAKPTVSSSP